MNYKLMLSRAFKISRKQEFTFGCLLETKEKLHKKLDTLVVCSKEKTSKFIRSKKKNLKG
jgi:hypothetical protein